MLSLISTSVPEILLIYNYLIEFFNDPMRYSFLFSSFLIKKKKEKKLGMGCMPLVLSLGKLRQVDFYEGQPSL